MEGTSIVTAEFLCTCAALLFPFPPMESDVPVNCAFRFDDLLQTLQYVIDTVFKGAIALVP